MFTATPRTGCQRLKDANQQKTGDEVGMDAMNSSGSSEMIFVGVLHDDPEETAKTVNLTTKGSGEVQDAYYNEKETSSIFVIYY